MPTEKREIGGHSKFFKCRVTSPSVISSLKGSQEKKAIIIKIIALDYDRECKYVIDNHPI